MRYDVFLSFRGEDIRRTFLSHLVHSFDKKGLTSVTSAASGASDNQAVRESLVAIIVISKNYTSLDLWVEELASIIAYQKKVVPVFLRVDPLDVLRVVRLAQDSVSIYEPRGNTLETVKNWLDGHVTTKSGFNSSDWEDDSQLVDQITRFISDTVTQYSVSQRWCPSLNWLTSPWESSSVGNTSGLYSSGILKGYRKALLSPSSSSHLSSPISYSINPSEIIMEPPSDEAPRSPVFQSRNTSETLMEPPSDEAPRTRSPVFQSSNPSKTVVKSSWWEKFSRRIPFVNRSNPSETIEEASCCARWGMKHRVEEVLSMLQPGSSTEEVRTIGIYGMEGVGKTTLAKYVYEEISSQFQHHFFISSFSQKGSGLLEILNIENLNTTTNFNRSSEVIEEMVGRKILLVADSVADIKQLKGFAKEVSLFGPGSRIIVITKDRSLLFQCGVEHIYQVGCPGYDEAIQLFSQYAFMQTNPVAGFARFSDRAVEVSGRIPLALKVLGSYLHGRDVYEWETTLRRLEETHKNYTTAEVLKYIGADDSPGRTPTLVELRENEENRFPLYNFTLQ